LTRSKTDILTIIVMLSNVLSDFSSFQFAANGV